MWIQVTSSVRRGPAYAHLIQHLYASSSQPKAERTLALDHGFHREPRPLHTILHDKHYLTEEIRTKDRHSDGAFRVDIAHTPCSSEPARAD
jgi:hypothetical protein